MPNPTIGRKLYLFLNGRQPVDIVVLDPKKPLDVNIAYVHDSNTINVAGFDHEGNPFAKLGVHLLGPEEEPLAPGEIYADWMPFQKGL